MYIYAFRQLFRFNMAASSTNCLTWIIKNKRNDDRFMYVYQLIIEHVKELQFIMEHVQRC